MLAMDVVDTLRHRRALVERELDDERRQRDFVERVQAIYEAQGIEVPEEVVEEGVRALREERFIYTAPERSLAVRLAEVYVERGKWALRATIGLFIVGLIWSAFTVPAYYRERGIIEVFEQTVRRMGDEVQGLKHRGAQLEAHLERAGAEEMSAAQARLLAESEDRVAEGIGHAEAVGVALTSIPAAAVYVEDTARYNPLLESYGETLSAAEGAFVAAQTYFGLVDRLSDLQVRLEASRLRSAGIEVSSSEKAALAASVDRVEAALVAGDAEAAAAALYALDAKVDAGIAALEREAEIKDRLAALSAALDGVDVEPEAVRERSRLTAAVEQAIAADEWERASRAIGSLGRLVRQLESSYDLRIVSGRGERSGVWRRHRSSPKRRNYYIIVEAVDAGGDRLRLPVTSEEDQATRVVRKFGIRVPEAVYEQVKADKLDNGIIDDVLFGKKRRGAREPDYEFPIAGGRITRW